MSIKITGLALLGLIAAAPMSGSLAQEALAPGSNSFTEGQARGRIEDAAPAFTPHPAAGLVVAARSVIEAWREAGGDWRHAVAAAAQEHRTTTWNVVRHAFA